MRTILLALLLGLTPTLALAQHSISLSWTASTAPNVTYNVYRAPCTGTITANTCSAAGTFAKLGNVATTTYPDATVTAGGSYDYYVTALCPPAGCSPSISGESTPSNHSAGKTPVDTPPPPTNLGITSVALNIQGTYGTVVAKWLDPNAAYTAYWIYQDSTILASGVTYSGTGSFNLQRTFRMASTTGVKILVCDAKTCQVATS